MQELFFTAFIALFRKIVLSLQKYMCARVYIRTSRDKNYSDYGKER